MSNLLDLAEAPATIDLLSLDVEGAELQVLQGIDHARHRFRYMLVECRDAQKIADYLAEHDYELTDQFSHHDYLFSAAGAHAVRSD